MFNKKKHLINITIGIVVILTALFFIKEFDSNIKSAQSLNLKYDFIQLTLAILFLIITKIIQSYEWYYFINSISQSNKINFLDAIIITNSTSMTKYLPGNIWEYALQIKWLGNHGFSKSSVLYVNLILIIFDYFIVMIVSFLLWLFINPFSNRLIMLLALMTFLIGDMIILLFKKKLFHQIIRFTKKLVNKNIHYYDISIKSIIFIQFVHVVYLFLFGCGFYLICTGLGLEVSLTTVLKIYPAFLISTLISMLIIIMPGGFGIREGSMYFILVALISKSYALIIPIALRIVQMVVELCMGLCSIVMLKKSFNNLKNMKRSVN